MQLNSASWYRIWKKTLFVLDNERICACNKMYFRQRLRTRWCIRTFAKPNSGSRYSTMDESGDDILRLLGPPPYQIDVEHVKRIFANYKPRDITIGRLIDAPPWIERAGRGSELYKLFWKNVPLIIPAETYRSPPPAMTGNVKPELDLLGFEVPSEVAWDKAVTFIETYFQDPSYSWLADANTIIYEIPLEWDFQDTVEGVQTTCPKLDKDCLLCVFDIYERLRCHRHPNRLTPVFIWKDCRRNRIYSKQPSTKRNIRQELGISQPMHDILNQGLDWWGKYLRQEFDINGDSDTFQDYVCKYVLEYIHALYENDAEKRGYMKFYMKDAFEAFRRYMDTDMVAWVALADQNMILPRPDLIRPASDRKLSFGFVHEDGAEDEVETDTEAEGGDVEMSGMEEDE